MSSAHQMFHQRSETNTDSRGALRWSAAACAGGMLLGALGAASPAPVPAPDHRDLSRVVTPRPLHAQPLSVGIERNSVHMFTNDDFEGEAVTIASVTGAEPGAAHELPNDISDDMTSLRWNLPPGVVVSLYEDAGAKGERMTIWGQGQMEDMTEFDFNDKLSRWSWFYVGGDSGAEAATLRGARLHASGAEAAAQVVAEDSMQLFRNKNFDGDMIALGPVTSEAPGTLHRLPGHIDNSMTSVRWNLPPGVVAVFYQDADGRKQQAAMWGQGEVRDVDVWDFNDKVSRWAWYHVGATDVDDDDQGMAPLARPEGTTTVVPVIIDPPAVTADDDAADQPIGWVQLWDDENFTGRTITLRSPNDVTDLASVSSDDGVRGFDNKAGSAKWHLPLGWQAVLYDGSGYSDVKHVLIGTGRVEEAADLGLFADKATSMRFERR